MRENGAFNGVLLKVENQIKIYRVALSCASTNAIERKHNILEKIVTNNKEKPTLIFNYIALEILKLVSIRDNRVGRNGRLECPLTRRLIQYSNCFRYIS